MQKSPALFRYKVRLAQPADIPAIRSMQERSLWAIGSDFYAENEIANFLLMFGTMDDRLVEEGHYYVVEAACGAVLGSGGWTRRRPAYAKRPFESEDAAAPPTIRSVFVDPAATRRGIASAILAHTEQDAIANGVDILRLTATLSGFALYEALGYSKEEVVDLIFPDSSKFKCIKMQKFLVEPSNRVLLSMEPLQHREPMKSGSNKD